MYPFAGSRPGKRRCRALSFALIYGLSLSTRPSLASGQPSAAISMLIAIPPSFHLPHYLGLARHVREGDQLYLIVFPYTISGNIYGDQGFVHTCQILATTSNPSFLFCYVCTYYPTIVCLLSTEISKNRRKSPELPLETRAAITIIIYTLELGKSPSRITTIVHRTIDNSDIGILNQNLVLVVSPKSSMI